MYLFCCPYQYALRFMLDECLFSTEHSGKWICVLGGGFIHFDSVFCQRSSSVCTERKGQRKTGGNQGPGEYIFFFPQLLPRDKFTV